MNRAASTKVVAVITALAVAGLASMGSFIPLPAAAAACDDDPSNFTFTGTNFLGTTGVPGTAIGQLTQPYDVEIDVAGNIYVSENEGHRIQKFNSTGAPLNFSSTGTNYLGTGTAGSAVGEFYFPQGIALDSAGNIYVADAENHRIQKFTSTGAPATSFSGGNIITGFGPANPNGVEVDAAGNIYVSVGFLGSGKGIYKYDSAGNPVNSFNGGTSNILEGFASLVPQGLKIDASGNLYVLRRFGTLSKYDSAGNPVNSFNGGTSNSIPGGVPGSAYLGVEVDAAGNIYVAQSSNHVVQKYDSSGNPSLIGATSTLGTGIIGTLPGEFNYPSGIKIDSSGNIFVTELGNHRIQKFGCGPITPPLSICAQDALAALGVTASQLPASAIASLESACTGTGGSTEQTVPADGTNGGSVKLNAGDVFVLGANATQNGATQTQVNGDSTTVVFLGAGSQVNGSVKNVGTIYVTGPGVTITGGLTGIGTLYYLPGAAPISVGGAFSVGTIIQL